MLTVAVQLLMLEVAAEGGFQRSAMCRIRGVGDRRWSEDVPRSQLQCASGTATYHGQCGPVGTVGLGVVY
jgi:hypothetical protein